ncbi:hypothetical protein [Phenylobacterium soli]|uniref:Glycosyl transferase family 1 domain-containing protein n=1 Tax=Phenylobacterium soli TaxID=2170551 RepID=A0A328AGH8_9CAUL|nr:hypothetical protein [Phenylobacterium soli]RAK51938.1 hypothetical protein DJ017_19200 [Phenylobacterium soli]
MAAKAPFHEVQRAVSLALDASFYRTVYDDIGPGVDALRHYLLQGWREGRDPAPWFSTRRYLEAHPDVAKAGGEPLHHYLTKGRSEGRAAFPSAHAARYFTVRARFGEAARWSAEALIAAPAAIRPAAQGFVHTPVTYEDRALAATEFDSAYYLGMNPDVAAAGTEPLEHFLIAGWREGRDPNPRFSVRDYLELYPDISQAGVNPFVHYLMAGRAEGRLPRQDLGFRYQILADLVPVETRVARAAAATAEAHLSRADRLSEALARRRGGRLHLTFSHDDYTANLGGVQLCLQREAARIGDLGRDHLHIYPLAPWPVIRAPGEAGALGVLWNGRAVGTYSAAAIAEALAGVKGASFAIHSMLGHSAEETLAILSAAGLKRGFFWLHDFASLCAGFHLLRDDVEDCAAPPPDSAACGICVYGPWRARHLAEHGKLFEALELTVVSPSQPTLDLWKAAAPHKAAAEVVLPHARLIRRGPAPAGEGPFRLAFAGMPAAHKGWPVFRELAIRFAGDPRYEFVHLGGRQIGGLPIDFRHVSVSAERPNAMQEAIAAVRADAVLVWPLCRETFSFTAYEAVAAGAAILTNPDSGNVAAFAAEGRHGRVLEGEAALTALFESGEALALSRAVRKPPLHELAFSAMTVDLLAPAQEAAA